MKPVIYSGFQFTSSVYMTASRPLTGAIGPHQALRARNGFVFLEFVFVFARTKEKDYKSVHGVGFQVGYERRVVDHLAVDSIDFRYTHARKGVL